MDKIYTKGLNYFYFIVRYKVLRRWQKTQIIVDVDYSGRGLQWTWIIVDVDYSGRGLQWTQIIVDVDYSRRSHISLRDSRIA